MVRNVINPMVGLLIAFLLGLAGCGSSGGVNSAPSQAGVDDARLVELKINLIGTLPASTAIAGAKCTLTLPANVAPATNDASSAVTPSGLFAGALAAASYTAATNSTSGKMTIAVLTAGGITRAGEMATVTLKSADGAVPAVADFAVSGVEVISSAGIDIMGMNAIVASVTLQ